MQLLPTPITCRRVSSSSRSGLNLKHDVGVCVCALVCAFVLLACAPRPGAAHSQAAESAYRQELVFDLSNNLRGVPLCVSSSLLSSSVLLLVSLPSAVLLLHVHMSTAYYSTDSTVQLSKVKYSALTCQYSSRNG